ncbi:MAG: NifB/NifX family molybdenum-iron cluster-binding protein, partial [Bacteroidales bacterium]
FHENCHVDDGHGAGQKAAELVVELGATKIISGDFGPKAKDILDGLNIQLVIVDDENYTVKEIIKRLGKK